ncbi:MAG TPA: hypothetical protein VJ779_04120 [Acetobacteraceae bacterium]|nr:hypothetical protein [Acetobacteraceae bacterium]
MIAPEADAPDNHAELARLEQKIVDLLQEDAVRGVQAMRNVLIVLALNCTRDPLGYVSMLFESVEAGIQDVIAHQSATCSQRRH